MLIAVLKSGGDVGANGPSNRYGAVVGHAEAVNHTVIRTATAAGWQGNGLREISAYGAAKRYGQDLPAFTDSDMVSTTPSAGSALAIMPFSFASKASVKALVSALLS